MSTGLLNQLEAYYTEVEAVHHDVTPDRVAGIVDRVREIPAPIPAVESILVREKPQVWVALAAAAVVILLVAVVPILLGVFGDGAPPVTDPTPTTSTMPLTTTVPDAPETEASPPVGAVLGDGGQTVGALPVGPGPDAAFVPSAFETGWEAHDIVLPDGLRTPSYVGVFPDGRLYVLDSDLGKLWNVRDDYGNSVWQAPAGDPTEVLYTSADGVTWQAEQTPFEGKWGMPYPGYQSAFGDHRVLAFWAFEEGSNADWAAGTWFENNGTGWVERPSITVSDLEEGINVISGPYLLAGIGNSVVGTVVVAHDRCWSEEYQAFTCDYGARLISSSDSGRTFEFVNEPDFADSAHDRRAQQPIIRYVFSFDGAFHAIAWSEGGRIEESASGYEKRFVYPSLWRSEDGTNWSAVGAVELPPFYDGNLHPSPCAPDCLDSRIGLGAGGISVLPPGQLLFHTVFDTTPDPGPDVETVSLARYWLSHDGLEWTETTSVPLRPDGTPVITVDSSTIGDWTILQTYDGTYTSQDFTNWYALPGDGNIYGQAIIRDKVVIRSPSRP